MVKSKFKVDEVVMALDKANVYEAKILKVQSLDNISKYFIHYNGWARKYDCWIEEGHLARKNADKDLAKLDELAKGYFKIGSKSVTQAQEEFISSLQKGSNKSSSSSSSSKSSKRKSAEAFDGSEGTNSEIPDESEEGALSTKSRKKSRSTKSEEAQQLEVIRKRKALLQSDLVDDDDDDPDLVSKIQLPAGLKRLLLDDWKAITKNPRKLVLLPVKPNLTVAAIINDFLEKNSKSQELTEYRAFFHGLKIQFNKSLPSILLFRQERDQFDKILEQCTEENYCDVYGAHHLLRFYVRLPRLLSHIVMAPRDLNRILSNLTDLLRFLDKNIERYHNSEDYVPANDALDHLHSATFAISK